MGGMCTLNPIMLAGALIGVVLTDDSKSTKKKTWIPKIVNPYHSSTWWALFPLPICCITLLRCPP